MPGAGTRGLVCKEVQNTHTSNDRCNRTIRHSLRDV